MPHASKCLVFSRRIITGYSNPRGTIKIDKIGIIHNESICTVNVLDMEGKLDGFSVEKHSVAIHYNLLISVALSVAPIS